MDAPAREQARSSPPATMFVGFLVVALSILGALHYYLWLRLVYDTALPEPFFGAASGALAGLAVAIPASLFWRGRGGVLSWIAHVWMGAFFLLFVTVLAGDGLRVALYLAGFAVPQRAVEGGAAVAGACLVGLALMHARRLRVREVEIRLPRLPAALDGYRIAQITDLHIGPTIGRAMVQEVVDRTNALGADLVAITGDLADGDAHALAGSAEPLRSLRARHGVFFVTGNHEYFGDVEGWLALVRSLGIRALRNERLVIGEGEASYDLAGIDDPMARRFAPGHGPDLDKALAGRDTSRALVLLAHRPTTLPDAAARGVDLVLSGHTHAGQIWPFRYFVRLAQPWLQGLHELDGTWLYVSQGTGWWGPPMRLGTTREVTCIVLRGASAGS